MFFVISIWSFLLAWPSRLCTPQCNHKTHCKNLLIMIGKIGNLKSYKMTLWTTDKLRNDVSTPQHINRLRARLTSYQYILEHSDVSFNLYQEYPRISQNKSVLLVIWAMCSFTFLKVFPLLYTLKYPKGWEPAIKSQSMIWFFIPVNESRGILEYYVPSVRPFVCLPHLQIHCVDWVVSGRLDDRLDVRLWK